VAEAVNSVLKLWAGWVSDRRRRRRPIVIAGYAISSAARPFIAMAASWPQVLAIRALDRVGKGIRGGPRDAMLAGFATPSTRGRIFGFHRAMDHAGAVIGPLAATVFLYFAPDQLRLLFALTAIPGAVAVAMLFLVKEAPAGEGRAPALVPRLAPPVTRQPLPRGFYQLLGVIFVFSLGNSADAFLLLRLGETLGGAAYLPLLWALLHLVKASLSTWGGALSDRLGRRRVIVLGWGIYAAVYLGFATASTSVQYVGWFLVYGVYFALTEGAEKALVADLAPAAQHGTAFGLYNTALGVGTLCASVAFGILYDRAGASAAFGVGAALAGAAALLLARIRTHAAPQSHPAADFGASGSERE
jgi:MFS family permease